VVYYKIAEHQEEPEVKADMNSSEVYLVAAHRELRSHQFYAALGNLHAAGEAREMLLNMANEELKHKEKMEYLYANKAFPQTSGG
jgi:rubrerythrin